MCAMIVVGGVVVSYFQLEREKIKQRKEDRKNVTVGKSLVGSIYSCYLVSTASYRYFPTCFSHERHKHVHRICMLFPALFLYLQIVSRS